MTTSAEGPDGGTSEKLWSHGGETAGWRKTNSAVGIAPRSLTWLDAVIMVAGVVVLMLSFFDYYTHTLARSFGSTSRVSSAWDSVGSDIWGCVAAVAVGGATLVLLLAILFLNAGAKSSLRLAVLGMHLVAAAALAAAYVRVPHYSFAELDGYFADSADGHGYAYWASIVLVGIGTVGCVQRLREVAAMTEEESASGATEQPMQESAEQPGAATGSDSEPRQTRAQRRAAESRRGRHSG